MAAFGVPGGAEILVIMTVVLMIFGPTLFIGWLIWLVVSRKSRLAPPPAPAGWFPDPTAKHESRFWNGAAWTADVSDHGVPGQDPV